MRLSVLKRVDELLFSSSKPRKITKTVIKRKNLSVTRNLQITTDILNAITDRTPLKLSLISNFFIFIWHEYIEGDEFNFLTEKFKPRYFAEIKSIIEYDKYGFIYVTHTKRNE